VGLEERENKSAYVATASVFSLFETHEPGVAGRRIDGGLHGTFVSFMASW
jgi:hypothetical protein